MPLYYKVDPYRGHILRRLWSDGPPFRAGDGGLWARYGPGLGRRGPPASPCQWYAGAVVVSCVAWTCCKGTPPKPPLASGRAQITSVAPAPAAAGPPPGALTAVGGELQRSARPSSHTPRVPEAAAQLLAGKKLVAVFFSARWSAPCLEFTPRLAEWYRANAEGLGLEIVYVSCDVDEEGFDRHFDEMPWLAIPFADRARAAALRTALGVASTPTVVVLDASGGALDAAAARAALPGLPEVEVLVEEGTGTVQDGLQRLRAGGVREYVLDGTTRGGKSVAGWHSREGPDKTSCALRCYLDGAVVRASAEGAWLRLERGHGFVRKEHWGAGWRSAEPEPAAAALTSVAAAVQAAQQAPEHVLEEPEPEEDEPLSVPPVFTSSAALDSAASAVQREAAAFIADGMSVRDGWTKEADSPSIPDGVSVWRKPSAVFFDGPVAPFKCSGVVKGVSPAVLASMLLDIGIKWPEKDRPVKKRKLEVVVVSETDWQTKAWYEHSAIPVPFVADRDELYIEVSSTQPPSALLTSERGLFSPRFKLTECFLLQRWSGTEDGTIHIARKSLGDSVVDIGTERDPETTGYVRQQVFVSTILEPCPEGTRHTMAMEFNLGGRLPARLIERFLGEQVKIYERCAILRHEFLAD